MKWIIRLLRDQFMSLCTHKDIRRFDTDDQIVISQIFDDMNFIQRTLHQSLCSDSMIFLHKFFLKRTAVYTNTNGYSSLLCHINHCFDSLCTADISGIDPDLICTVFHLPLTARSRSAMSALTTMLRLFPATLHSSWAYRAFTPMLPWKLCTPTPGSISTRKALLPKL